MSTTYAVDFEIGRFMRKFSVKIRNPQPGGYDARFFKCVLNICEARKPLLWL